MGQGQVQGESLEGCHRGGGSDQGATDGDGEEWRGSFHSGSVVRVELAIY